MSKLEDTMTPEELAAAFSRSRQGEENVARTFAPGEYALRAQDSVKTRYNLPAKYLEQVDKLAMLILPPGRGRVFLTGYALTGKSFLLDQIVANRQEYGEIAGLKNAPVFFRVDPQDMCNPWLEKLNSFYEEWHNRGYSAEEIIFYTESPDVAITLSTSRPDARIVLELVPQTLHRMLHIESMGASKLWGAWEIFDISDFGFKKKEITDSLIEVVVPGINATSKKVRQVYKKDVVALMSYIFKHFPFMVDEDGFVDLPIGRFARYLQIFAGHLRYFSARNPEASNSDVLSYGLDSILETVANDIDGGEYDADEDDEDDDDSMEIELDPSRVPSSSLPATSKQMKKLAKKSNLEFGDFDTLEARIAKIIRGQDRPIHDVVEGLSIGSAGLTDPKKPLRSFLFMGPTGVGKTRLAEVLAETLYTTSAHLERLDMSEYQSSHEASKLFGSPPGYVGHETGGILTNAIMKNPVSIILLDEAEKAHPKVWDAFLQILDSGRLTDNTGKVVDFSKCIIILTSNLGVKDAISKDLGFGQLNGGGYGDRQVTMMSSTKKAMKDFFRPEFLNRIDETVYFNELPQEIISEILALEISIISNRMEKKGFNLEAPSVDIFERLMIDADVSHYGARELQRIVQKHVAVPIAGFMLKNKTKKNVVLEIRDGKIAAAAQKRKA